MRTTLVLLALTVALLTAIWLGGETLLARSVVTLIAEDPRLQAASVDELREGRRVGLGFTDVVVVTPEARIAMPALALWVPPQQPNEVHASLPTCATLEFSGRTITLGATTAEVSARFAPARGFALWRAEADLADVTLDGAPAVTRLAAAAQMTGLGHDAPQGAGATYDIAGDLAGVSLPALSGGEVGGIAGMAGKGRIWLTEPPVQGGDGAEPPALIGLRADGVRLSLDDLAATLWGRVVEGGDGLAEGQLIVDTADAPALLARAAALGILPQAAVPFASMMLQAAAATALPGDAAPAPPASDAPPVAAPDPDGGDAIPPPAADQMRIIITFRDGKSWLGAVPVGPAPRFR